MRLRASRRSVSICDSPGPLGADAAVHPARAEALEVRPQASHAREVVLELGELDLELALGRAGVVGEDVEDDRRAVDHRDAELLLEVALLSREQLVVDGDQVRVGVLGRLLQLRELPATEVAVRVRPLTALHHLAGDRHAGGAEELAKLREVELVGGDSDGERALCGAGRKAAWRALENALPVLADGKNAGFMFLPDGEDPDDFVRRRGKAAFEALAEHAMPGVRVPADRALRPAPADVGRGRGSPGRPPRAPISRP